MGEERDHSSLQERTGPTSAAPLLIDPYVRCAYYPWHASTHGFLQKMATWHMRDSRKIGHLAVGAAPLPDSLYLLQGNKLWKTPTNKQEER